MDRMKSLFQKKPAYEPVNEGDIDEQEEDDIADETRHGTTRFSWVEYSIFLLLGIAMLWAWNMFLAAAAYFQRRFHSNDWILNHFQAAEISVSTVANLGSMIVLTKLQKNASYPKRISSALIGNIVVFAILAVSTRFHTSAEFYFAFLLVVIFFASLSTGFIQNGLFSFASGFSQPGYIQAIMTGQAVAGVLPPLAQIISVAATNSHGKDAQQTNGRSSTSAFIYFLTATLISFIALVAFLYLLRRKSRSDVLSSIAKTTENGTSEGGAIVDGSEQDSANGSGERPTVPLLTLFDKLKLLSISVFLCFGVTMMYPVFTASIFSVSNIDTAIFIPTAFLLWNLGDLVGRLVTLTPKVSLVHYPFALFCITMARFLFIPLYFMCNIKSRGAIVNSDLFYLVVVQFLFGLTNGYLGNQCMMGAGEWVAPEEREAAGGFMSLMLIAGVAAGSLASFALGNI